MSNDLRLVHIGQIDYDILLDKGNIEARRVTIFETPDEKTTYSILVDGQNFKVKGKFVNDSFYLLNADGKIVTENVNSFRNDIERRIYERITTVSPDHNDHKLAKYLKECLDNYVP